MSSEYKEQIEKIINAAPTWHPFIPDCRKATSYLYEGKVVYVPSPAFEAYTYPVYDRLQQSLVWSRIEFITRFEEELYINLCDLLVTDRAASFETLCKMFDIPELDQQLIIERVKNISADTAVVVS